MRWLFSLFLLLLSLPAFAQDKTKKPDGNRLAYLDEVNPYYPHKDFPKLTTPMWVGDKDVEAVVILAIDDMRNPKKYETFLRPILRRLKEIDGRSPVSIMTNQVNPKDPQLQEWLKEGLSLECHTFDHPCPFFKGGFDKSKETYDKCVDLMHEIPNNKPVAFRMPCCDSMNTPSPRFYAEIFNKVTAKGHFLSIDTSVFNYFTSADPELPKELVLDDKGQERFKPYLPADRSFVNTIENYPYPYVIGRLCWQFPCVTPSDWQAQHRQKPNNPKTVEDWKAALDCTVIKQGVFCLVFHPHGWIRNDQVVELIDHAVAKHGKKVKFLNFREAQGRLDSMLFGTPIRDPKTGAKTTVVVSDQEGEGFSGVQLANKQKIWLAKDRRWREAEHTAPVELKTFDLMAIPIGERDYCLIAHHKEKPAVVLLGPGSDRKLGALPFGLPPGAHVSFDEHDTGLRFIDLNHDGKLDLVFSNEKEYGIYLFENMEKGWSKKIMAGKREDKDALPMISRKGTNNGFWVHSGHFWWANEDTMLLKDHVDRRNIQELLNR